MRKNTRVIVVVGTLVFVSFFCSPAKNTESGGTTTLTLLCWQNTEQNVFRDGGSTMYLVFHPLFIKDEEGRMQPRLLESWEHSEDYTEWTLHLRQGVRWNDGTSVTARDVKFTLELLTEPSLAYETRYFGEITIADDLTCRMRSQRPFDPFAYRWYGIIPEHLLRDQDIEEFFYWDFWKHPVGNGPYRYVRHVPGVMVELESNPDYYGEKPGIEKIILKFGTNRLTELLGGNVDAVSHMPTSEILTIKEDSRFEVYHGFSVTEVFSIIWNHDNPMFKEADVRRAITLAINRAELHRVLNFPESTPIIDAAITPNQFFRGELPEHVPFDPKEARKLLAEEGWVESQSGGVRNKEGREFRFSLFVEEELVPTAVYVQDQLRRVGIHMEIDPMQRSVFEGRRQAG
jgi:peptide/nickel transport system substrate-binding protein